MTIDSLVQIVALIIAIYALVPRVRQLELRIQIGAFELFFAFLYFTIVLFLLFYDVFLNIGLVGKWKLEENIGLSISLTTFLITLLFLFLLWWRFQSNVLPRKSIFKFQELAEELLQKGEYSELISLLDRYWNALIKIEHNQFILPDLKQKIEMFLHKTSPEKAIRDFLETLSNDELESLSNGLYKPKREKFTLKAWIKKIFVDFLRIIALMLVKILPNYKSTSEVAGETIRVIFSKDDFVDNLSKIRPYFALDILRTDSFPRKRMFFSKYLKFLLLNSSSILYYEISRIQNSLNKYSDEIPESLRLLRFLLNDAKKAEEMAVWEPIGNEVLRYLKQLSTSDRDYYNFSINNWGEEEDQVFNSPIYVAIHFFDLMVGRALHQNVKWHMDLYYFPHFVGEIIENYNPHSSVDLTKEWPTRYSYLIYLIIKVHEDWMEELERLPSERLSDWVMDNTSNFHENDNIPKSSLIALGFSLEKILLSETISNRFKDYLVEIVFRLYFRLSTTPLMEDYGKVLFSIFKSEGIFDTKDLKSRLKESFQRLNKISFMEARDFYDEFSK